MAKRVKSIPQDRGTILFDVVFEDGSRASNRRVPMEILGGLDGDDPARQLIEEQEAEIAEKAGRPPRRIQSLVRSASLPRGPRGTSGPPHQAVVAEYCPHLRDVRWRGRPSKAPISSWQANQRRAARSDASPAASSPRCLTHS